MARLLLIDDDDQLRELLRRMLEYAGHEVVVAPDGAAGAAAFRSAPTDLVITDILMPGQEGLETIIGLKGDYPTLPIIAISGGGKTGSLDFLDAARALGAVATLAKPFTRQCLLDTVHEALAGVD